ncbi:MAG: substrate-binding domain-containing protein [Clostridia bacterium]|jgi:DNA-binding LacI/PurR family transcriptional regulator
MTTIRDIAKASGYSISTVSIILRGEAQKRKIPQRTQEKILEVARSLKYQPNLSARKLRDVNAKQYTIGLYWAADSRSIILARILKSLQQVLLNSEYNINLVISPYISGRLCEDKLLQGISSYNAVIIATTDEADMNYLEENPPLIPNVLYNRYSKQFSCVTVDNMLAGRIAAMHLLNKRITDIGLVIQSPPFFAMEKRRKSFIHTCDMYNVHIKQSNIFLTDGTLHGGYLAGNQIVESKNIPKALFCDDASIALGILNSFAHNNIRVPDDVEIISICTGLENFCQHSVPSLTVVELPLEEMALQSIHILIDILMHKTQVPKQIVFQPKLIVRDSCK